MAQRTHLNDAEKRLIVRLSQNGMKAKQISRAAGVKLASIYTLLRRQKLQGTTDRAKGSGRPRKLSPRVLRILKRVIVLNKRATLAELTSSFCLSRFTGTPFGMHCAECVTEAE